MSIADDLAKHLRTKIGVAGEDYFTCCEAADVPQDEATACYLTVLLSAAAYFSVRLTKMPDAEIAALVFDLCKTTRKQNVQPSSM